jgi:hypothetical protein
MHEGMGANPVMLITAAYVVSMSFLPPVDIKHKQY